MMSDFDNWYDTAKQTVSYKSSKAAWDYQQAKIENYKILMARRKKSRDEARAKVEELTAVLQAAVDCGMVPITSALEGGAARFSEQVRVADLIRAALKEELK